MGDVRCPTKGSMNRGFSFFSKCCSLSLLLVSTFFSFGVAFNVIPEAMYIASPAKTGQQGPSSYFGYAVEIVGKAPSLGFLVGAPRGTSSSKGKGTESGTVFKCAIDKPEEKCTEIVLKDANYVKEFARPDYGWLGAALDVDEEGNAIICAPRWVNKKKKEYRSHGACYTLGPTLEAKSSEPFYPMNDSMNQIYYPNIPYYAYGQCGFSVHFARNKDLLIGGPGILNWRGSVVKYRNASFSKNAKGQAVLHFNFQTVPNPVGNNVTIQDSSYLGLSLTSGYLYDKIYLYYISGAPKGAYAKGRVMVFRVSPPNYHLKGPKIMEYRDGTQTGEYFGASVAALDLNGDGLEDLVVGAPMHSHDGLFDAGCAYVYYMNKKTVKLPNGGIKIFGDKQKRARFGTALGTPGDLDMDGYPDLLVGAPYENEGRGSVYVFTGSMGGLGRTYSQKLSAEAVYSSPIVSPKGFGVSFSKPKDVDQNGYPDFAVGSFLSEEAVLLHTRVVLAVRGKVSSAPRTLSLTEASFVASACVTYGGHAVPEKAEFTALVSLDVTGSRRGPGATFRDGSVEQRVDIKASANNSTCVDLDVTLKRENIDARKPILIMMEFELTPSSEGQDGPILSVHNSTRAMLSLPFTTGCKGQVCTSDLKTRAEFVGLDGASTLVIGRTKKASLNVVVWNLGDAAFFPNVTIAINQEDIPVRFYSHDCAFSSSSSSLSSSSGGGGSGRGGGEGGGGGGGGRNANQNYTTKVICQLQNPIEEDKESVTLELDLTNLDDRATDIQVNVEAMSAVDKEINFEDNRFEVTIKVEKKANVTLSGWSQPEQFVYTRLDDHVLKANQTLDTTHVVTILKSGVTPVRNIFVQVDIPTTFITPQGESLVFVTNITNELIFESKLSVCDVTEPVPAKVKSRDTNLSPQTGRKMACSDSQTRLRSVNCSTNLVQCSTFTCNVGPWKSSSDIATLRIKFQLNLNALGDFISVEKGFILSSSVHAQISGETDDIIGQRTSSTSVQTFLSPSTLALRRFLSWWIYLVACLGGLLFLLIIIWALYKVGFFKRKTKEEMMHATLKPRQEQE